MTATDTKIHFIGMTGAGAEVEHAPLFTSFQALQDWLHAYAASNYAREFGSMASVRSSAAALFDDGYEVEGPEDRWRAAVQWAVEAGRGEWYIGSKSPAYLGPKGEPMSPEMTGFVALDEEYLETLRTPAPTL